MRELLKCIMQSASSSLGTLVAGVVSTKLYAIYLGPAYNAVAGLISQMVAICVVIATAAGITAFLQGASRRTGVERWRFIKTVARFYAVSGLALTGLIFLLAPLLAQWLFPALSEGTLIVRGCGLVTLISIATGMGMALLQVEQIIGTLAKISLASGLSSIACAAITAPLIETRGFWLVPLVQLTNQTVILLLLSITAFRRGWFQSWRTAGSPLRLTALQGFWAMAAAAVFPALAFYGSQLVVRSEMNRIFGLVTGGLFIASLTICSMYVDLLLRSFQQVYLPRVAAADKSGRQVLLDRFFRITIMAGIPLVIVVSVFRRWAIEILFHDSYAGAAGFMSWMLPGDVLKMFSWLFGMILLGAGDARHCVISDMVWCGGFLLISVITMWSGFTLGPGLAFSAMYAVTLLINITFCARHHDVRVSGARKLMILASVGVVGLASTVMI